MRKTILAGSVWLIAVLILAGCASAGKAILPTVTLVDVTVPAESTQVRPGAATFTPTVVSPAESHTVVQTPPPATVVPAAMATLPTMPQPSQRVLMARQDLAKRINLDIAQIQFEKLVTKTLPQGAKCAPDAVSMPPFGAKEGIQLQAGEIHYIYFSNGEQVLLCVVPAKQDTEVGEMGIGRVNEAQKKQVIALAQQDLAKRLGVATAQISVVSATSVQWPDASLGCPKPGQMYAQVITPGLQVVLKAGGKTYEYHTSYSRVQFCK